MRLRTVALLLAASTRIVSAQSPVAAIRDSATDPYLWLEAQRGDSALAWVARQNERTLAVLERDPRFAPLYAAALGALQARDRIPTPTFIGGAIYNFWQDSAHVRGIWRRTTLASYRSAHPRWTTVLDLDSLARAEQANWVWAGAECAMPAQRRCMIVLSDGGADARTWREFDVRTRRFVDGGFVLPRGRQWAVWQGEDTLLVTSERTAGEVTKSGYPYVVSRLVRGRPLDRAAEVYRGAPSDQLGVVPQALDDGAGHHVTLIVRRVTSFEAETYIVAAGVPERLAIPARASAVALVDGQVIVQLAEPWTAGSLHVPAGALASFDAARAARDPARLSPTVVLQPGDRESIGAVAATRDRLVVSLYHNVRGQVFAIAHAANGSWTKRRLPLPDNLATDVSVADLHGEHAVVSVTGFLTPSSIWLTDARLGTAAPLKALPAMFDASRDTVEQLEAVSSDGTRVPYFVVRPGTLARDGSTPTILTAYGGFGLSRLPSYSATIGKLWLEHGGVYVSANIRGGGEFGPAWHEAGLKTRRQTVYDDFAAVARDLVARGITSKRRLGIMGGSNGGLLMGVELTQHPELWSAVDIQVPLLDMLRYEEIDAGASWVGEYGSASVPAERAFLASISPYQNLRPGVSYPETFVWTTTNDDRVGPQHARKFAARMAQLGAPYLFYEVTEGGHAAGANLQERARTSALEFTYFARRLLDTLPTPASAAPR